MERDRAMRKLITIFMIPELRRKIYITALFLIIYRIG
jgi:preprotein translocase subunit SecY